MAAPPPPLPIPMDGTSLTVLRSHYALLEDAVTAQLGPLAGRIVRKLSERGDMTLREVAQSLRSAPFQTGSAVLEAARAVGSRLLTVEAEGESTTTAAASASASAKGRGAVSLEPSVLVDTAVTEMVTRLTLHRVVAPSEHQSTYELRLGCGLLLHVLHPLIALAARQRYGQSGEALTLVLRQLAVVPLEAAVGVTRERCPSLSETEIRAAAAAMRADRWLEDVGGGEGGATAPAAPEPGHKRGRGGEGTGRHATATASDHPLRLCLPAILRELLCDALCQWVSERFPDAGLSTAVVSLLFRSMYLPVDGGAPSHEPAARRAPRDRVADGEGEEEGEEGVEALAANPFGFPPLAVAPLSPPATPLSVSASLNEAKGGGRFAGSGVRWEEVLAAMRRLATPTSGNGGIEGPLLSSSSSSSSSSERPKAEVAVAETFSLRLSAVVSALRLDCCERVVFSRHGVLGVRLMKLLLKHRFLEDRTLAEEAVATQPRTRHTLSAMMRDGYVCQQEVSRGVVTSDRQPKSSIFLWTCSMEQCLAPAVREHLAGSLLHALAGLREAVHAANSGHTSGGLGDGAADTAGPSAFLGADGPREGQEAIRREVRGWRRAVGLESAAMSLLRMLLVIDCDG